MNTISKQIIVLVILGMCVPGMVPRALLASGPSNAVIPAGTKISVLVLDNIDGVEPGAGESIDVYTVNEVRMDGTILIPAGTLMHAKVTNNPEPPDHGLRLYSVRLTDVVLQGANYPVVSDSYDVPVDPATGSPYPDRATNTVIPANTALTFTLRAPLAVRDGGAGTR